MGKIYTFITVGLFSMLMNVSIVYAQNASVNSDFELGNFTGWTAKTGARNKTTGAVTWTGYSFASTRQTIISANAYDPYTCNKLETRPAGTGNFVARLGNALNGGQAEALTYTMAVTAANALFFYRYAVVFEEPDHALYEQPFFELSIKTSSGTVLDSTCGYFKTIAGLEMSAFDSCTYVYTSINDGGGGGTYGQTRLVRFKPWTTVAVDLSKYIGQTIQLEFVNADCSRGGHWAYSYMEALTNKMEILVKACSGDSTATLTAPSGFASYLWSNGDTARSIVIKNPVYGTTMTCNMTTTTSCSVMLSAIINVEHLTISPVDTSVCLGKSATLSVNGTYSYTWSNGLGTGSSKTVTPTGTTIYTVTATSESGCSVSGQSTVSVNLLPVVQAVKPTSFCAGGSTTISASGASTYLWSNSLGTNNSVSVSPTTTTTYFVTGTDANNCSDTSKVTITVFPLPTVTLTPSPALICAGQSSTITAGGGVSYTWNNSLPSAGSNTVYPTVTTTYSVTATNSNNCTNMASTTVTVEQLPTISISAAADTICIGDVTKLVASGAVTYIWDNGVLNNVNFSPTVTKIYSVTGTNAAPASCKSSNTITIVVNPLPSITPLSSKSVICLGDSVMVSAGGAKKYTWDNGVESNLYFKPTSTNTYTVTGTDSNGCVNKNNVAITVNPLPTVTAMATPPVLCIGKQTILNGAGAKTYAWDNSVTDGVSFNPTTTKIYSVTGTDVHGCQDTSVVTVTVNPLPTVTAKATPPVLCIGKPTIVAGSGAKTYAWDNSVTDGVSFNPTTTKIYTVTGTDVHGCQDTSVVTVTVNPLPLITASDDTTICYGDTAVIYAMGNAASYTWGSLGSGASQKVAPISATMYSVTASLLGCVSTDSVTVLVYPKLYIDPSKDTAICIGKSVTFKVKGNPLAFQWEKSAQQGDILTVSPVTTTTYNVVGYYHECKVEDSVKVIVNPLPTVVPFASSTAICPGDQVTVWGGGVISYRWNNNITNYVAFIPASTATYLVTGTDANGCENTSSIKITVKPLPQLLVSNDTTICYNGTASIKAWGNATSYVWNSGLSTNASQQVKPLQNTTYSVTAVLDNCLSKDSVIVKVQPQLHMSIDGNYAICKGLNKTLTVSGNPLSYTWSAGLGSGTSKTVSPQKTTTYSVVGDYYGCKIKDSVIVKVNELPLVLATASDTDICIGESVQLSGVGATSYTWSNSVVDKAWVTPGLPTRYTVTGTDLNGCINTSFIDITVHQLPVVSGVISKPAVCRGDSVVLSGQGAATYAWDNSVVDRQLYIPQNSMNFSVTGTDEHGCKNRGTTSVIVHDLPNVSAYANPSPVCFGHPVLYSAAGAQNYIWSDGIKNLVNFYPEFSKYYKVTGIDYNGCAGTDSVYVKVTYFEGVSAHITDSVICDGEVTKMWGEGVPTYEWSGGATDNVTFAPQHSGYYVVTGTNVDQCKGKDSVYVRLKPIPPAPVATWDTICFDSDIPVLSATGDSVRWFTDAALGRMVYKGNQYLPPVKTSGKHFWYLNQTIEGCTSPSDTAMLYIVEEYKSLKINTRDTAICEFPKRKSIYAAVGTLESLDWRTPVGVPWTYGKSDSTVINVQWSKQGVDTITLSTTDKWGCTYSTSQIVSVAPYPVADFRDDPNSTLMKIEYTNLSDSSVITEVNRKLANTYRWDFGRDGDTMMYMNRKDTTLKYKYGYYDVTLIANNEFNCSDTITRKVFIDILTNLYVPNAFVPGHPNPELNKFRIKAFNLKTYEIYIYDTWGNLLWYSDKLKDGQPLEGWDGTYDGVPLKQDSYVWKMDATFNDGTDWFGDLMDNGKFRKYGSVVLVR